MVPEAEYRKVEEHEPVHPRLWAEMSPPPTRFNRRNAEWCRRRCSRRHPNANVDVRRLAWAEGRTQPDLGNGIDLQQAREKTATGNLTDALVVQHVNEGRHERNDKGVDPDIRHAGRAPVVVRGRESRSHGEGEQFELLGVHVI